MWLAHCVQRRRWLKRTAYKSPNDSWDRDGWVWKGQGEEKASLMLTLERHSAQGKSPWLPEKRTKAASQDTWAQQLLAFKSGHRTSSVSDESSQSRHKITLVQAISLSDSWGDWRERKTRLDLSFFHLIEATVAEASGAGSVGHSMHIGTSGFGGWDAWCQSKIRVPLVQSRGRERDWVQNTHSFQTRNVSWMSFPQSTSTYLLLFQ